MKDALAHHLEGALATLLAQAGDRAAAPPFRLERSRQPDHGDFACNAAMQLAKRLGRPPREIAAQLIEVLGDADGLLDRCEVAGPGFVNIWLTKDCWQDALGAIVAAGSAYGRVQRDDRPSVQVEFVSANPTGPLSIGHGRQAVLGDCIANLLTMTGFDVTREYYYNDGGRQMRVLGDSLRARYLEVLGRAAPPPPPDEPTAASAEGLPVEFPEDGYRGEYLLDLARALVASHGETLLDEPGNGIFRETAEREIFQEIRQTLDRMGVVFDEYFNERSLYEDGKLEQVLNGLREKGLVYEADDAVWLKATALSLDRDRVLVKRTGEPTYLLPDIAYHLGKFKRGFEVIVDVLGADHIEQFPFVRAAIEQLGCDPEKLSLVIHQFVTLTRGGEKVKQSTRRANFVTIDHVVSEVGIDVFRFFMIERRADGHLDFDMDLAMERNWRKNPAFYVQYAHARTHGIERKARKMGIAMPSADGFSAARLALPEELDLIKKLGEFPELVERAAATYEPHHVAYYLRDLAGLWNPYLQDGSQHRVVSDDDELTRARLGLVLAVRTVLANGLGILGLGAPEEM